MRCRSHAMGLRFPMTNIIVRSSAAAERANSPHASRNHKQPRGYVAKLAPGLRGSVDRYFFPREKVAGHWVIHFSPEPEAIYEIRRWHRMEQRTKTHVPLPGNTSERGHIVSYQWLGGTVWIGFDDALRPTILTREEAFSALRLPQMVKQVSKVPLPGPVYLEPIMPEGIELCRS